MHTVAADHDLSLGPQSPPVEEGILREDMNGIRSSSLTTSNYSSPPASPLSLNSGSSPSSSLNDSVRVKDRGSKQKNNNILLFIYC